MKITGVALVCPPLAIVRYHTVVGTAGPIGVFWLAGLTSLFYGLTGGYAGDGGLSWPLLWLGALLWLTSAVWARLVIGAVDDDIHHRDTSPRDHKVLPNLDEPDPFNELKKGH